MSWFDAGALANIAKSALKEAQRTIDKALDIKEDGAPQSTPVDPSGEDFFGTWGVAPPTVEATKQDPKMASGSIWGSFSGSFFVDHTKEPSIESLADSGNEKDFSDSKLVVQQTEEEDSVNSANPNNRLSVISLENNSESVDVCTTPESDFGLSEGLKQTSDSVEILGDSLTSPSSIEIIDTDDSNSRRHSQQLTDEFISPLESPVDGILSSMEKTSPESVEIIPEEQEETSIAEDTMSYTSISESTSTTILDSAFNKPPQKMLKDTYDSLESAEAITKAPVRTMHLPLIDVQKILEKTNIIDIPHEEIVSLDSSTEDGSISDKTLVETQAIEGSSSDTASTTTDVSSNSTYLKKMLADAMAEKSSTSSSQIRETSPLSSENCDLVKIGSDHTSCHTSCDELETTTSSDIEIISSPNGSSTQSRQSPIKKPKSDEKLHKIAIKKGHNRELSGASSISDDSHPNGDIDRLLKRIAEMTEILESRENKLIESNRRNAELQEQNSNFKTQLDCILTQQLESADLSQVTEEYTQRLSALEKKFQQALREKDTLKKQLEQAKLDVATRLSKNELESAVADKEEIIRELRQEGEKLSKQQLQHGNIIKKLRAKEKEHEATIKNLREINENLTTETDRLKKSLSAKEEVERTQIEAVHNLTQKHKKLEADLLKTKSQLDDLTQKHSVTKKSLEAAKLELQEQTKSCTELQLKQNLLQSIEDEKKLTQSQNEQVISQLDYLRDQLTLTEDNARIKEQKLRLENAELLRRLEEAENRNEELTQTVLDVSKPLVRQLETLQATHNMKMSNYEKLEQELTLKINDLLSKNQSALTGERAAKEESVALRTKMADLEGQLGTMRHQIDIERVQLEQIKTEQIIKEQDLKSKIVSQNILIKDKDEEISQLRQQLAVEKLQQQESPTIVDRSSPSPSPTLSLGKASIPESLSGSFWSQDEPFEATHTPRYTNMFEMQMLQSNLKQREGELQQLQWELNRREQERSLLNSEISTLINKVEQLEIVANNYEEIKKELASLQQQYDTLCQLFGEKVEETEELKLDLVDVKDMYKSQIDELLRQQKEAR